MRAAAPHDSILSELDAMKAQRDELAAALRLIATAYAGSSHSSEYMQGIARAALAKVQPDVNREPVRGSADDYHPATE
jgi:hypothetical protein